MSGQFTEIERKFLLDSFPKDLPLKEEFQVYQAYLSIDPEVRIRRNVKDGKDTAYYLAIKSSGEMVRKEIEIPISKDHFYALAEMVTDPFITKDFRIYQLDDGLVLECSHVDKGLDTEFLYAEVEFPSIEAAESFKLLPNFTADVTKDSSYKMKNFWKRTRGPRVRFWCDNQRYDENGILICLAHMAEARVFNCPYKDNADRLDRVYPCSDYQPVKES